MLSLPREILTVLLISSSVLPNSLTVSDGIDLPNQHADPAERYILSVYAYDGELDSQTSSKYVFIDARNVSSIGYITDDDSDGRFDMYHSNSETIHTQIEQFDNTMINIDSDGDGVFDHMFNTMTGVMDNDPSIDGDNSENLIIFSVLIIFVAFALIGAIILLRRKKL